LELLAEFGGYEIAMLTGAVLAAAARQALILVDGFTVTVAAGIGGPIEFERSGLLRIRTLF